MAKFDVSKLTGLAREIDPRLPSNRFMVLTSLGAGATATAWAGVSDVGASLAAGVVTGMAVFLSWAIAREVDPDHNATAGVAMLMAWALLTFGRPSLAASAAVLIAVRVTIRSTGVAHRVLDRIALVLAAAYLGNSPEAWVATGVLVVAVAADGTVLSDRVRSGVVLAMIMAVAAVGSALVLRPEVVWQRPNMLEVVLIVVVSVASVAAVVVAQRPESTGDYTGVPLSLDRLRAGRAIAAASVVMAPLLGAAGVVAVTPVAAALVSAPIVILVSRRQAVGANEVA